jgi:two-component system, cell cycle sensor histidine kinase and response regulator CckA
VNGVGRSLELHRTDVLLGSFALLATVLIAVESLAPGDPLESFEIPSVLLLAVVAAYSWMARRSELKAVEAAHAAHAELERENEERRRTEGELRNSEQRLRFIQDLTKTGTWDVDLETGKALWSDGSWTLLGLDEAAAESSFDVFVSRVHPEDRDRVETTVTQAIDQGETFEAKFRVCHPDGTVRVLFSRGLPLYDEGKAKRFLGLALDVTEREEAEAARDALERQLRQAQKMEAVGQLAGGIAHDFNNLLLALKGYGELALRAIARGEDASGEVEEMLSASERATALTSQLLAFSRRQMLQPQVVSLNYVVTEMGKLLVRLIGEDVEIDVVVGDEAVWVNADRSQLEQVIANLAVNARDAMPDGGSLRLEISSVDLEGRHPAMEAGRYALLAVSDTGSGMDAETAAQIFEPFYTTKAGSGTGLGLATVHGIVKQSGGHIWVYSEPGQGTTFKVYLPLAEEKAASAGREQEAPTGGREVILLVEDDVDVRRIVHSMLEERGYRVLAAASGDEALLLAGADTHIDLVLTDIVMRGLNGREVADRLRLAHPDIAVLYMSGYTDDGVVHRGLLSAQTAFIQKPFGSDELARKVRAVLDKTSPASR